MPKAYLTVSGDMWDMIAKKTLGGEMRADALIEANIKHRDIYIFPANVRLAIPSLAPRLPDSLPPWKRRAGA
jgi:hypothetical protein